MKRGIQIIGICLMLIFVMAACSSPAVKQQEAQPTWKIAIQLTGDKTIEFTDLNVAAIGTADIKATLKKKDGTAKEQQWTGVALSKVLEHVGVKSYSTVVVEAADGYNKEYTPDLVDSPGTVLAVAADGTPLDAESGPVQLVVDGKGGNWWIKQVAKITVNE
ncbi:MAG: molybdopterin-dependent oxidoreductase [Bacillota bacterium]